jgi:hypothetical protein
MERAIAEPTPLQDDRRQRSANDDRHDDRRVLAPDTIERGFTY